MACILAARHMADLRLVYEIYLIRLHFKGYYLTILTFFLIIFLYNKYDNLIVDQQ